MNDVVKALVVDDDGNLIAGGEFTTAGGEKANRVAKWDGFGWSTLGSGMEGSAAVVEALALRGDANLYAGGVFRTAGGKPSANIGLRWELQHAVLLPSVVR